MNCNIYFYLCTDKGYSQYPDNYTKDTIKSIVNRTEHEINKSQFAIYRDGKLAYLTYQYHYAESCCFGVCCEYNSVIPTNLEYLFNFFDNMIVNMLHHGSILHYTPSGEIRAVNPKLADDVGVLSEYNNHILKQFNDKRAKFVALPPYNYTAEKKKVGIMALDECKKSVIEVLQLYDTIIIVRQNPATKSYTSVLKNINAENAKLKEEIVAVSRMKNKYRYVVILACIVVVCAIAILLMNNNVNSLNSNIDRLNQDIDNKEYIISDLSTELCIAKDSINAQANTINRLTTDFNDHKKYIDTISRYMPMVVYNIEMVNKKNGNDVNRGHKFQYYDTYELYVDLSYYSLLVDPNEFAMPGEEDGVFVATNREGYQLVISVFDSDRDLQRRTSFYTNDIWFGSKQTQELSLGNSWHSGDYYLEITHNNSCIASTSFTVE